VRSARGAERGLSERGLSERGRSLRGFSERGSELAGCALPLSFSSFSAAVASTSPILAVLVEATSVLKPPLRRRVRGFLEASVLGV
jgi:hypothetical protein